MCVFTSVLYTLAPFGFEQSTVLKSQLQIWLCTCHHNNKTRARTTLRLPVYTFIKKALPRPLFDWLLFASLTRPVEPPTHTQTYTRSRVQVEDDPMWSPTPLSKRLVPSGVKWAGAIVFHFVV